MKISVVRSGGFAGLSSRWEVTIDGLDDRDAWLQLIDRLPWTDTASERQRPDAYNYRIECSAHQITLPEHQVTGAWRELVDRVQKESL